jgi:hypothetical protein
MNKDNLGLAQLVDHYQLFHRASGKSPNTVAWYEARLAAFLAFLGPDPKLRELTPDSARAYIVHLQGRTDRHAGNPLVKNPRGAEEGRALIEDEGDPGPARLLRSGENRRCGPPGIYV